MFNPLKNKRENEHVILIVRRHWFDILKQFFTIILALFLWAGSFFLFSFLIQNSFLSENLHYLILLFQSSFVLLIWLYSFLVWIDYYFDVWIITTEKIINIEQKGLFLRHTSELQILKIQDVSTEVKGLIPSILNYGEVHIQSAGTVNRFLFHNVPDPYAIKKIIMDLQKNQHQENFTSIKKIFDNYKSYPTEKLLFQKTSPSDSTSPFHNKPAN